MSDRVVEWEGCVNVRDLGGLPLRGGGQTRFGSVYRADNLRHLTARGWSALRRHGVRTVVDLRFVDEAAQAAAADDGVAIVNVSLFGVADPAESARIDVLLQEAPGDAEAVALLYTETLERCAGQVAGAVRAVADAAPGAVAVHCFVGKDRTGIVAAVLLDLAGVERDAISHDYAMTEGRVGPLVDDWIAQAENDVQRSFRARISTAPIQAMELTLETLEDRHGGVERYLRDAGLGRDVLERARARLVA